MNKEQAKQLLDGLGSSSRKVAATLRAQGIKGGVRKAMSCPISNYLKKHGAIGVGTSPGYAVLYEEQWEEITLPIAVKMFVASFDRGRFSDLQDKSK